MYIPFVLFPESSIQCITILCSREVVVIRPTHFYTCTYIILPCGLISVVVNIYVAKELWGKFCCEKLSW